MSESLEDFEDVQCIVIDVVMLSVLSVLIGGLSAVYEVPCNIQYNF